MVTLQIFWFSYESPGKALMTERYFKMARSYLTKKTTNRRPKSKKMKLPLAKSLPKVL